MQLEYQEAVDKHKSDNQPRPDPPSSPQIPLPPRRKLPEPIWLMPVLDISMSLVAFVLAYIARYELTILRPVLEIYRADFAPYIPYALVYAGLLYLTCHGGGLYKNIRGRALAEEIYIIANGVATSTVLLLSLYFAFQPLVFSRLMLIYVAAINVVLLSLLHVARRMLYAYLRSRGIGVQRVLIVGAGETGQAVLRVMMARKDLAYDPIGFVDDNPEKGGVDLGRVKGLGNLDNLRSTIRRYQVDVVVVTIPWSYHERIQMIVRTARKAGAEVQVVPDVFQLNMRQVQIENLDGIPLLGFNGEEEFQGTNRLLKRLIDITLILLASPVLLIVFALTALAIRLEGTGPIFYTARRVGENGREFDMIKFRSMIPDAELYRQQLIEKMGQDPRHPKIRNDPRITQVGMIIRTLSIDELPQLINVLRGQMSLVGPRPPTPDEVLLYEAWHMRRLQIIPGITGLWQVSGRSEVPFDEMCLLDIYYIENWSIKMDLQIMAMTLPRVLLQKGAY